MLDSETVIRAPHSPSDQRVSATMKTHGCELLLFFDDLSGEGPLRELRLLPGSEPWEPWRLMPQVPLFLRYARAAIAMKDEDTRAALRALRAAGTGRRGHDDDFYRLVGASYAALVAEGERYPVKALADMQPVNISTASRWITEAKRRGLIPKEASHAR